jgi:hypothetical protein
LAAIAVSSAGVKIRISRGDGIGFGPASFAGFRDRYP